MFTTFNHNILYTYTMYVCVYIYIISVWILFLWDLAEVLPLAFGVVLAIVAFYFQGATNAAAAKQPLLADE